MSRFVLCCLSLVLSLTTALAGPPRIMSCKFPSSDLVIAQFNVCDQPYGAVGDGKTDSTSAFQHAIDDAAKLGGAVVFAPSGIYRFDGNIDIKPGVTLRGEWVNPKTNGGKVKGTVLAVYAGRGKADGTPFISMRSVSCVSHLSIWYPDQLADSITPYPWAIRTMNDFGDVHHITFVNSYNALVSNEEGGSVGNNVCNFSNLYGCPLKQGIFMDDITDITRTDRVYFGPQYWQNSGLIGAPTSETDLSSVRKYLLDNATGITVLRFDWCPLYQVELDGYGVGIRLAHSSKGESNGGIYGARVEGGRIGLLAESVSSGDWLISRSTFRSNDSADSAAVVCSPTLKYLLQFNTCTLGSIRVQDGSVGGVSLENCRVEKPLTADSGEISLVNTQFKGNGIQVRLGKACSWATLTGCKFADGANAVQALVPSVIHREDAPKRVEVPDRLYPFPAIRRPRTDKLMNVHEFGAKGDGKSDDTAAFAAALMEAGKAGGTVYIPAGFYRITQPLTVPTGVELRGIAEGPTHTAVPGSCIMAESGQGEENGAALISLETKSGIRGLTVCYPMQDIKNIMPYPWTIRALGTGCWVRDVALANPWQAVDFASAPDTSDHLISGLTGAPMRRGLFVDHSPGKGFVENLQFVIHYWSASVNEPALPRSNAPTGDNAHNIGIDYMHKHLQAFQFGDCGDESVLGTFVYASDTGLAIQDKFHGNVQIHGSDNTRVCVLVTGRPDVALVNTICVALGEDLPVAFRFDDQFTGKALLLNSCACGDERQLDVRGSGSISIEGINIAMIYGGLNESVITNPNARLSSVYAVTAHKMRWTVPGRGNIITRYAGFNTNPDYGMKDGKLNASAFDMMLREGINVKDEIVSVDALSKGALTKGAFSILLRYKDEQNYLRALFDGGVGGFSIAEHVNGNIKWGERVLFSPSGSNLHMTARVDNSEVIVTMSDGTKSLTHNFPISSPELLKEGSVGLLQLGENGQKFGNFQVSDLDGKTIVLDKFDGPNGSFPTGWKYIHGGPDN